MRACLLSLQPCLSYGEYHVTEAEHEMREHFDEIAGKSETNPMESARRSSRAVQRKRFYANAGVGEADGGFTVTLDGKPVKTPSGRTMIVPVRSLAETIAAEWNAQGEFIEPLTMPVTRFANSVVQGVVDNVAAVSDDIAKYFGSDLLFYRAGHPEGLVAREAKHWDPVLFWAAQALGAHFILAEGVMHVRQPESAIAAARGALPGDPWAVAALHLITTLTGSALLALALFHGVIEADQVWAAAHVDEDWNAEKWGVDDEVAARKAAKSVDFNAVAAVLKALCRE
jgi:chaperone required for assembly of F1-ATPase